MELYVMTVTLWKEANRLRDDLDNEVSQRRGFQKAYQTLDVAVQEIQVKNKVLSDFLEEIRAAVGPSYQQAIDRLLGRETDPGGLDSVLRRPG